MDFAFLTGCYFSDNELSVFNMARLVYELRTAIIVPNECLPDDVVRTNSDVLVRNINQSKIVNVHIAVGKRASYTTASYLLNVALMGYQTGTIVEWEMNDGITHLQIISVHQANAGAVINPFIA